MRAYIYIQKADGRVVRHAVDYDAGAWAAKVEVQICTLERGDTFLGVTNERSEPIKLQIDPMIAR